MSKIFQFGSYAIFVACCLLVSVTALSSEKALEDDDYFPAYYTCPDTLFNFAAALHWISEEWKKNAPYEVGYPVLYSILIALPLLPFLCFMIPTKESLERQLENERKRQQEIERKRQQEIECERRQENEHEPSQAEDKIESDSEDDNEFFVPETELNKVTDNASLKSFVCSKSGSLIGERLAAVEVNKLELSAPHVAMREEFPDLTTIDAADSFSRLKELGVKICPESTMVKVFVAVVSGALISYGLYRLFSK